LIILIFLINLLKLLYLVNPKQYTKKIEIEDIDDSDSISSDSLHENAKKIRHKKKSHHHKQAQVPQTPNPHMLLPPYNNNYRYCYYYHLPPPPPSLLKKFKKEAKERSGYYRSPFNEAYLPPPVLLHIPNGVTEQDFPQLARGYNTQYPMY